MDIKRKYSAVLSTIQNIPASCLPCHAGAAVVYCCHTYLCCETNATRVLVIQQQPFWPVARIIGVITLCAQVCGIAHHVEGHHIQHSMCSSMHRLSEGDTGLFTSTMSAGRQPNIRSLVTAVILAKSGNSQRNGGPAIVCGLMKQ